MTAVAPDEHSRRQRINRIAEIARQIQVEPGADVYSQVHDHLSAHLPDYQLPELVDAIHFLPGGRSIKLIGRRRSITLSGRTLDYLERQLQDSNA